MLLGMNINNVLFSIYEKNSKFRKKYMHFILKKLECCFMVSGCQSVYFDIDIHKHGNLKDSTLHDTQ